MTLGWKLSNTAQDELFAAIESTAFHTRIILERMAEHSVPVHRLINCGGIPQKNESLNQVYANVLNKPLLVPQDDVTSLGSAIFGFLAAGAFRTVEEAQSVMCSRYRTVAPQPTEAAVYQGLYPIFRELYFKLGDGSTLPSLEYVARETLRGSEEGMELPAFQSKVAPILFSESEFEGKEQGNRIAKLVSGVYAAVITPREADGRLCEGSLRKSIEFLLGQGIRGFAFNGATGEYCLTTPQELRRILGVATAVLAHGAEFLCGIGSASIRGCLENADLALDAGAKALLLPAPHYFKYEQDDLAAFCRQVAHELPASVLLYNLPQFTGSLEPSTVQDLITECPNIVGIKDSSGSLEMLRGLTQAAIDTCRIVGNDCVLARALEEGVCDGVISGVAGVLPELILALYALRSRARFDEYIIASRHLDEFTEQISRFPTPWGLKLVAESRGMASASFSQPLSERRIGQARHFQQWFQNWLSEPCFEVCT